MCGIVGYCGPRPASPVLMAALARLEYRGYDSSGIATVGNDELIVERRVGKLSTLRAGIANRAATATTGIGHTRWATHGAPTEANAHPHRDCHDRLAIVHNGIIENFASLRADLERAGHTLRSETDSEAVAHLIEEADTTDLGAAFRAILPRLEGAFTIAVTHVDHPGLLVATRRHAPLVIGRGEHESFLASDPTALAGIATEVIYLEDGDIVELRATTIRVTDREGADVIRAATPLTGEIDAISKGDYEHYMRKEIEEQSTALRAAIAGRVRDGRIHLAEIESLAGAVAAATRIEMVACGSAYYAALIVARLIERWAGIVVRVSVASEFRYSPPALGPDVIVMAISQSGETADTLAATRLAQAAGAPVIAVVNAAGSSLAREADATVLLQAGPEIAVAATKSFTAQATVGAVVAAVVARLRESLTPAEEQRIAAALTALPSLAAEAIAMSAAAVEVAARVHDAAGFLYLGRGAGLPAAMEGALKLKEVSYVHADGYAAGELKHGPIALVDPSRPVVAVATASTTLPKLIGNLMEAKARGGMIIAVAESDSPVAAVADLLLPVPACDEEFAPIIAVIPLQRFAYEHAVARGLDVDQPRNIAKSVTVE
jgi:glucosamine--fructose-6-phosphate aminotransferase (isomerizing)